MGDAVCDGEWKTGRGSGVTVLGANRSRCDESESSSPMIGETNLDVDVAGAWGAGAGVGVDVGSISGILISGN
jgi:hypothetical protein